MAVFQQLRAAASHSCALVGFFTYRGKRKRYGSRVARTPLLRSLRALFRGPEGNIFFCGEHTSQDFQGFMEGGASTGEQTAAEILRLIRRR